MKHDFDLPAQEGTTPLCDFCTEPEAVWRYPTADFILHSEPFSSSGPWHACHACHCLIDANLRSVLLGRVLKGLEIDPRDTEPATPKVVIVLVAMLHEFFEHRQGDPVRIGLLN